LAYFGYNGILVILAYYPKYVANAVLFGEIPYLGHWRRPAAGGPKDCRWQERRTTIRTDELIVCGHVLQVYRRHFKTLLCGHFEEDGFDG